MATAVHISQNDMHAFLAARDFRLIPHVPGTKELVYGKIVDKGVCLRVYTSVVPGCGSRGTGKDAIRCCLFVRDDRGQPKIIGSDKRVHRVEGWRANLALRLDNWRQQLGPACPNCGRPTVRRKSRRGPFWGCSNFPSCVSITPITHREPDAVEDARVAHLVEDEFDTYRDEATREQQEEYCLESALEERDEFEGLLDSDDN
jgi:hypothetical protein